MNTFDQNSPQYSALDTLLGEVVEEVEDEFSGPAGAPVSLEQGVLVKYRRSLQL